MLRHFARRQPASDVKHILFGGLGATVALAVCGYVTSHGGIPLLIAPFGATCVLLFSAPSSHFSQPANVIGGHALATGVSLLLRSVMPNEWWSVALAAGLVVGLMSALRITHPPAGADPLVIFTANPDPDYFLLPVLAGSMVLALVACLFHRAIGGTYPASK